MRIVIDLVVNHTSDQHPWFQSARSSPASPYRDWYVWSESEPPDRRQGIVFPGEQTETWTYDEVAKAWYYHRFYDFQPDLNWSNPAVRAEIKKVMGFWLQMGASGFRVDAAPFVLEQVSAGHDPGPMDYSILDDWRQDLQWRSGDAVLLCEANVSPTEIPKYTGTTLEGPNDRAHMMFSFLLNARLWLALARREAEPLVESLEHPAGAAGHGAVGDVPAQPRRTGPEPADRRTAPGCVRRVRAQAGHAAVRPGHPAAAGPDAARGPTPDRTGLRTAVRDARHPGDPLRRGDRNGGGLDAARSGRPAHPDAMGRRTQRRLQFGRSR